MLKRTVMDPAPTLDRTLGGFSKDMKLFVEACLVKDPEARSASSRSSAVQGRAHDQGLRCDAT